MNKNVSVIMPMINYDDLFEKAYFSIKEQSLAPYEIIIVVDRKDSEDDFSYNEKYEQVQNLLHINSFIQYQILSAQKNLGPGAARRLAQQHSKDNVDWFAFIDSDDYWLPDHLENFFVWLESNKQDRNILYFDSYNNVHMPYKRLSFLKMLISPRLHTPSAIISKTGCLFNQGRHSEDISYWIQLLDNGYDVFCNNIHGSSGRATRFSTGQSNAIFKMAFNKIIFLIVNYFMKRPLQTSIGILYEILVLPTRFFRKS